MCTSGCVCACNTFVNVCVCVCGMYRCVSSQLLYFLFLSKTTKINTNENENEKITCAHFVNIFELLSLGIHACKANMLCYILTLSFIRSFAYSFVGGSVLFFLFCIRLFQAITLKGAHRVLLSSTNGQ